MTRFKDRVVVVTGAAAGIGEAIATRFAEEGAHLLLSDINEGALAEVAECLKAHGGDVATCRADVSIQEDNERMIAVAIEKFGQLDVLANNAGIGSFGSVVDLEPADWRRVFAIGLDSVFFASRVAIPHLVKTRGTIVNTASISALGGEYGMAAYASMKAGLVNLTRSMALDHGRDGVRVNAVAPFATKTPAAKIITDNPRIMQGFRDFVPLGRLAEPYEVAAAVAFLASSEASFITGVILPVDGGVTASSGQPDLGKIMAL